MDTDETKKVLLVEDDQFLAALLKTRLQKENFEVIITKNGEEAIKNLEEFVPDLILLDIILPGKSGFEILEEMQANPKLHKVPVLIISNLGQESDIARGRELGAIGYFVKARTSIDEVINEVKKTIK
jgi:DNA-binding response OmpR family regulator